MIKLAGSILDWLKSLYGPRGSQAHTPYFHGKPFLSRPVIEAIYRYEYFLDADVADELVKYVESVSGGNDRVALRFDDIVQYRMNDIDEMFESFFEPKGLLDDDSVQHFIEYVKADLVKAWEDEFTGPQLEKQPEQPKPLPTAPQAVQQPQSSIKSPTMDFIDAVREAKDLLPQGADASAIGNELLELFLGKSGWAKTASTQDVSDVDRAKAAIEDFLSKQADRKAWEPFTNHLMQALYKKWGSPNPAQPQIGILQNIPKKTVIPMLRQPAQAPAPQPLPQSAPAPVAAPEMPQSKSQGPAQPGIRRRTYDDADF